MSNTSTTPDNPLNGFLADTWWFALTRRLPDEAFAALVEKRVKQGFTAVQLVVGPWPVSLTRPTWPLPGSALATSMLTVCGLSSTARGATRLNGWAGNK